MAVTAGVRALLAPALTLAVTIAGCGVRHGAPDWIGSDAAVVRCTVSGPNLELPRLLDELPSPIPPAGLYARVMDPLALDELGFERDRVVCATLQAPDATDLDEAERAIAKLLEQRRGLVKSTRRLGGCRCAHADALGVEALVPGCLEQPSRPDCTIEREQLDELQALLAPFEATLAETPVPRTHWRLFGRTDRRGRFAARHDQVLARYGGGSEVFLPRTPLPPQPGSKLLAGLLAADGVVAVVRQDGGRGLVVVRELGDDLVFDHFSHPDWHGAGVRDRQDPELFALLAHMDDAQLPRYLAALEPPRQGRELLLDPRKGYTIELDHAALERVDRATVIAAEYAQLGYDQARELRELPPLLVDRIAYQVVFGTDGEQLAARLRLTDEGRAWLAAVAGQSPVAAAATLSAAELTPSFEPAKPGFEGAFVLRGRPVEQALFAGVPALPKLVVAIAGAVPGAIDGTIEEFTVALPSGPLPGELPTRPGLAELRERLSKRGHTLRVESVESGRVLAVELGPE